MSVRRWSELLRIGRTADRASSASRVFVLLVACATTVLILALAGWVVIDATYAARAARDSARSPVASTTAQALWWSWQASSIDGQYVDVIHVAPLVGSAPLPPGLEEWPEPGEVVASPALAAADGFDRWVTQFGSSSGSLITSDGLADPGERIAYHRPAAPILLDEGITVSGFGVPHGPDVGLFGSALRTKSLATFRQLYVAMIALPCPVLVLVAVRVDGRRRGARLAALRALGASGPQRATYVVGAAAPGVLVGCGAALVSLGLVLANDFTMPIVDFTVQAADVRTELPRLIGAVAVGVTAMVVALVAAHTGRLRAASKDVRAASTVTHPAWLVVCPAVTWLTVVVFGQAIPYGPNVTTFVFFAGTILSAATVPLLVSGLSLSVARLAVGRARRAGWAGVLAATRQLTSDTRGVTRLGAALAVVIVLAVQAQVLASKASAQALEAERIAEITGREVVAVEIPSDPGARVVAQPILERSGAFLLIAGPAESEQTTVRLFGNCRALDDAGLKCSSYETGVLGLPDALRTVVGFSGGADVHIEATDPIEAAASLDDTWWSSLLLVSNRGPIDVVALNAELSAVSTPAPTVEFISDSWRVAAADSTAKARWLTVFSWVTVGLLALALSGAALAEQLDVRRSTSPWAILGTGARTVAAIHAWRILVPLVLALASGLAIAVWLAQPLLLHDQGGHLEPRLIWGVVVVGGSISAALWAFAVRLGVRDLQGWRPGIDR